MCYLVFNKFRVCTHVHTQNLFISINTHDTRNTITMSFVNTRSYLYLPPVFNYNRITMGLTILGSLSLMAI